MYLKMAHFFSHFPPPLHFFVVVLFLSQLSSELPNSSQSESILNIRKLLQYAQTPTSLEDDGGLDLCNTPQGTPQIMTISCYEDDITQLHFNGIEMVPPLPANFSIDALFQALVGLPNLKVLSLASVGIWGSLPPTIGKLYTLEMLNLSSNYLNGSIPLEFLSLRNLQSFVLDHNMLTGHVPAWLSSFSALNVLSLKNNSLGGSIPASLSSLWNLRILDLSMNRLYGDLPDLSNLTNLQVLDFGNNSLGPHFPNLHNKVVALVLRGNRFRFGLMENITSFYQLQKLDVSLNEFVGPFSPSLLSMPLLSYLDIAGNKFTGVLLTNMSCGGELEFVNLSSNYLTGELPTCLSSRSSKGKDVWYGGNCLSVQDQNQRPYPVCQNEALAVKIFPQKEKEKRSVAKAVLAVSIVGGAIGTVSLMGLVLLLARAVLTKKYFKRPRTRLIVEKATPRYSSREFSHAREICQMMKLGPLGLPAYRNFSFEELKEATEGFSKSSLIGQGSHSQIFKGKLAHDIPVAIRSLEMRKRRGVSTYTEHVELLAKLRHAHLVSALGHCFEYHPDDNTVRRILIVFEFLPNGTVRDWIKGQRLTWLQRITAAIGVAKGIQFLHTGILPGLFFNNLRITDVLLDHNLQVKLTRYNLPLLSENSELQVDYVPGCIRSKRNSKRNSKSMEKQDEKSDMFDFGVILLEIVSGRTIASYNEVGVVKDLFQVSIKADKIARRSIVDPAVRKDCSDDSLKKMMELCVACLASESNSRPSIEDILWNLHFVAQLQSSGRGTSPNERGSPIFCST
ncbi:putative inactive leucine-rich repeat receptor-like protein [Drosera capensis]